MLYQKLVTGKACEPRLSFASHFNKSIQSAAKEGDTEEPAGHLIRGTDN
jgi:hypothetical protein